VISSTVQYSPLKFWRVSTGEELPPPATNLTWQSTLCISSSMVRLAPHIVGTSRSAHSAARPELVVVIGSQHGAGTAMVDAKTGQRIDTWVFLFFCFWCAHTRAQQTAQRTSTIKKKNTNISAFKIQCAQVHCDQRPSHLGRV
jgi:hypothetical protein